MTTPAALCETRGPVLLLQMNQPRERNPLSAEMKKALEDCATRFADDPALRCLLLTGTEDVFCAGGDLRSMASDCRTVAVRERLTHTHRSARILAHCEKPVITAVNGAAVGAGMSLALIGDIVIASEDAWFMAGFPKVGVLPDFGLLHSLPRTVGTVQAKDLLLTNRKVPAAEAREIGLVSRVLPKTGFLDAAMQLATQLAQGPAVSMGLTKALMNGSFKDSFDELLFKESLAQAVVFGTDDFQEGNSAFRDKRAPRFTGR